MNLKQSGDTVDTEVDVDLIGFWVHKAITFDFHDTLVHCDEWFDLEVKHFPSAFLNWHQRNVGEIDGYNAGVELDRAYRRLRLAIIQHGHELSAERCIAVIFQQAGLPVDDEVVAEGVDALMQAALAGASAVPGALDAVTTLATQGLPLGVVSSAVHHSFLEWSLAKLGMRDAFSVVVTSASCGYYKSRPEIFWHALDSLRAEPSSSIHVGDSARFDVDGAGRAGMQTVWLNRGSSAHALTRPTLTVGSLEEIAPVLLKMGKPGAK